VCVCVCVWLVVTRRLGGRVWIIQGISGEGLVNRSWLVLRLPHLHSLAWPSTCLSGHAKDTGTQEGYWMKAARPIYPGLDCRCGA